MRQVTGIAGQYCVIVPERACTFYGNIHSPSIYWASETGLQSKVDNPERFGPKLSIEWVERFFNVHAN